MECERRLQFCSLARHLPPSPGPTAAAEVVAERLAAEVVQLAVVEVALRRAAARQVAEAVQPLAAGAGLLLVAVVALVLGLVLRVLAERDLGPGSVPMMPRITPGFSTTSPTGIGQIIPIGPGPRMAGNGSVIIGTGTGGSWAARRTTTFIMKNRRTT